MDLADDGALVQAVEAYKAGQHTLAIKLFEAIIQTEKNEPEANYFLGLINAESGNIKNSLLFFKTALRSNPRNTQFWVSYIEALINLGRIEDATAVLKQFKEKGGKEGFVKELEERLNPAQNDPTQELLKPLVKLYTQGLHQQALEKVEHLAERFPNSALIYNLSGVIKAALNQLDYAIDDYKAAIKIKPDYAEAYSNLGTAFKSRGDLELAISSLKRSSEAQPNNAITFYNLGNAMLDNHQVKDAIAAYKQATVLKPDFTEAHHMLGSCLQKDGNLEAALKCYKNLIKLNPSHTGAYYTCGNILEGKGDLEGATEYYGKAVAIEPRHALANWRLGIFMRGKQEIDISIRYLKIAAENKPDDASIRCSLGIALCDKGDLVAAMETFNQTLRINPTHTLTLFNKGALHLNIGEKDKALASLRKVVEHDPKNLQAQHLINSLSRAKTDSPPRDYVENLFDNYAPTFDEHLQTRLDYKAPQLIADFIQASGKETSAKSVLDMGCGTGLFGELVKDSFSHIEGIDLSAAMLGVAGEKNVYDKLSRSDITEYLTSSELDFDYFIALDTFVYVGNLEEIFRLIRSRTNRPGQFMFSTEHSNGDGFNLETSGRYSHSQKYIESLCLQYDYQIRYYEEIMLRKKKDGSIRGALYALSFGD